MLGWSQRKQLLLQMKTASIAMGRLRRAGREPGAELIDILSGVDTCCQSLFDGKRYVFYHQIFAGLIQALSRDWQQMTPAERKESSALCQDILGIAIKAMQQEKCRRIVLFLPYKATMWDSLESVWRAAEADESCEAYVMPIPYFERKTDYSFGDMHYEGNLFPDYVPILDYQHVSLAEMHPDVIYIHNPYDNGNLATSVAPQYYSAELKAHTDILVYIPYFATSGGMGDGQRSCFAYQNTDYIIVQAESLREFYDPQVDRGKILALGSPKFDRIVRICRERPEPPSSWKSKMAGKNVFFYNTSLAGMINNPWAFLKKMEYVFHTFEKHPEVCLLWRPHPLLENTFRSMRKDFLPFFLQLKQYYLDNQIGIYDDTPDIDTAIAWSDAYIGDSGTSVTSLFGVAGKPIFIFNNLINRLPQPDDWRGNLVVTDNLKWVVTGNNDLLWSPKQDGHYAFYCRLSEYTSDCYYGRVFETEDCVVVCPANGQDILLVADHRVVRRIPLQNLCSTAGRFAGAWQTGRYIFLIPLRYPAIVRCDIKSGQLDYVSGYADVIAQEVDGAWVVGGSCVWQDKIVIASPTDGRILLIDAATLQVEQLNLDEQDENGILALVPDGDEIWCLPRKGYTIRCWNPCTGTIKVYEDVPEDFHCEHVPLRFECELNPWSSLTVAGDMVYLAPHWGNRFLQLNKVTGEFSEWKVPFQATCRTENGYLPVWGCAAFLDREKFYYAPERRIYYFDGKNNQFTEYPMTIDEASWQKMGKGFGRISEWQRYGCLEDAHNTLKDFLKGDLSGKEFSRSAQLEAYSEIAAHIDGTAGAAIHQYICEQLDAKQGGERK